MYRSTVCIYICKCTISSTILPKGNFSTITTRGISLYLTMSFVKWSTGFVNDTTCRAILPISFTLSVYIYIYIKILITFIYCCKLYKNTLNLIRPTPRCELRLHAWDILVSGRKVSMVCHVHEGRAEILRHIHRSISVSFTPILSKTHPSRVSNSEGLVHSLYVSIRKGSSFCLKSSVLPFLFL